VPGEVDDAKSGRRCARRSLKIFLLCFPSLFAGRSSLTASGACRGTPSCCMRAAVWLRPTSGGKTFSTMGRLGGTMPSTTGTRTLLALAPRFCMPWMASFDRILRYVYGSCRPSLCGWPCFPIGTTAGREVRHPWEKCCRLIGFSVKKVERLASERSLALDAAHCRLARHMPDKGIVVADETHIQGEAMIRPRGRSLVGQPLEALAPDPRPRKRFSSISPSSTTPGFWS